MTADLGESCADLARWLPVAAALMAEPDTEDGTDAMPSVPSPYSRPPWNPAAANAAMDAHEGLRRLEASLRLAVTGHPGFRRGGSTVNTFRALGAIEDLGAGVTGQAAARAARFIDGLVRPVEQLPAVDKAERPQQVSAKCPYCGLKMLRVYPREGRITCLRYGACWDSDGCHPVGMMEIGRLGPQVRWNDGLVAP